MLRQHHQLLLRGGDHVHQHRAIMGQGAAQGRFQVFGLLHANPQDAHGIGHGREVRFQLGTGIQIAGRFHFHGDKTQRRVIENTITFAQQLQLRQ